MSKSKFKRMLILNVVLILVLSNVTAYLRMLILNIYNANYNLETFITAVLHLDIFSRFPNISDILNFKTYTSLFQNKVISLLMWVFIVYQNILFYLKKDKLKIKEDFEETDNTSHGSMKWQTSEELAANYGTGDKIGWLLGSEIEESFDLNRTYLVQPENQNIVNSNVNVLGPSGQWKSTAIVMPNIFHLTDSHFQLEYKRQFPKSTYVKSCKRFDFENQDREAIEYMDVSNMPHFFFGDPKMENYELTANFLLKASYDIWIFDFLTFKRGDQTNPLDYIVEEQDIARVARNMIHTLRANGGSKTSTGNEIWINGAILFVQFAFSYAIHYLDPELHTMEGVITVFNDNNVTDPELAPFFHTKNNLQGITLALYQSWLKIDGSLRDGILGGLSIDLMFFNYTVIKKFTEKSTVDFNVIGTKSKRPIAIYTFFDPNDPTFSPILNVTINNMFSTLYKTAAKHEGSKLPNKFYMILDEKFSLGAINGLDQKLSNMRSFNIKLMLIWQDLSQPVTLYGEERKESIFANSNTFIILGAAKEDAEYVEDLLGRKTIKINSGSKDKHTKNGESKTISESFKERKVMYSEEVKSKPVEDMIIDQLNRRPALIKKVQYEYWKSLIVPRADVNEIKLLFDEGVDLRLQRKTTIIDDEVNVETTSNIEPDNLKIEIKQDIEIKPTIEPSWFDTLGTSTPSSENIDLSKKQDIKLDNQPTPTWFDSY